jgi:superfamily I DNA/RNA helicase
MEELNIDPKQYAPRALQSAIGAAKSRLLGPAGYSERIGSYFEEIVHRVYERYQGSLTKARAVDFDDLLMKTVLFCATILRSWTGISPDMRTSWLTSFRIPTPSSTC